MKTITFAKGGTAERTVNIKDIVLPEPPTGQFPEDNGIYALMVLAHDALLRGKPSPIWKQIRVPDMWHRYMELVGQHKEEQGKHVEAMWHMTRDMVRQIQESL